MLYFIIWLITGIMVFIGAEPAYGRTGYSVPLLSYIICWIMLMFLLFCTYALPEF